MMYEVPNSFFLYQGSTTLQETLLVLTIFKCASIIFQKMFIHFQTTIIYLYTCNTNKKICKKENHNTKFAVKIGYDCMHIRMVLIKKKSNNHPQLILNSEKPNK